MGVVVSPLEEELHYSGKGVTNLGGTRLLLIDSYDVVGG